MRRQRLSVEDCHSLSAWWRFEGNRTSSGEWYPYRRIDDSFSCEWWEDEANRDIMALKEGQRVVTLQSARGESKHTQHILLTTTPCHYGGLRYWFLCPECERRVGKLYVPADGESLHWLCRHCYGLTYEQRRAGYETPLYSWRAHRLLERNGIKTEDGSFHKPPGMRCKTFHQLQVRYNALIDLDNMRFVRSFGSSLGRLLP